MKKVIWTGLVMVTSTAAAALAARALGALWRRVTHEDPPESPRWAHLLMAPVRHKVTHSIQDTNV